MNLTSHQRPGVYSIYDASTTVSGNQTGQLTAIAAMCQKKLDSLPCLISTYEQAISTFGATESITNWIRLMLLNGSAGVYVVPVAGDVSYNVAFSLLQKVDGIAVVTSDSGNLEIQKLLRDSVQQASEARKERIAVLCAPPDETLDQLISRANTLNSERVVLTVPGSPSAAAAFAGAIAGESDPAIPLGGVELKGLSALPREFSNSEIDKLILAGVTPLETVNGSTSVVRAVTTRTKTGSVQDPSWRELSTIRIVDNVIPALRTALHTRFHRAKNTPQSRDAIRSQVIVELEQKKNAQIITDYDQVIVSALPDNPTVCLVEFNFTVAHGLNQIWLSAHITI